MKGITRSTAYMLLCLVLTACAVDVFHVKQLPTQIEIKKAEKSGFKLDKEVAVKLDTGYNRTLKKGSRWTYFATITQGDVFKTGDQVLTVEAANIHEAYIVVSANKLIGFYLPVERTFSPLSEPLELSLK